MSSSAYAQQQTASTPLAQGVLLLREGHANEAMPSLNAAVAAMPHSAEALTWRGICENQTGSFAAAARDLKAAVRLDPKALPAHYNLALSLIRLREVDGAMTELKAVLQLQPEAVPALYNLAVLLEDKHDFGQAAGYLRQAHALAGEDAGVSLHLLQDLLQTHQEAEVPSLAEALADARVPAATQQQAGAALLEARHFSDAATLLEHARAQQPEVKDINLLLARAYVGAGRDKDAEALLAAAPAGQNDEELVYTAGLASLGAADQAAAVQHFQQAATLDPNDARPLYHLALLSESSAAGRAQADALLHHAVQLDPGNRTVVLALARLLLTTDKAEEAKTRLLALPPSFADEVERSTLLGVALASTNELTRAIPQLQHAVSLNPELGLAHNVLGFCFFRSGDYAPAAESFHRASNLEPKRLLYARDAALAYLRAAAVPSAIPYAERAVSLPGATPADTVLLGKLYAAAGRPEDAIRLLRRAAEADPSLDSAVYLLARTYSRLGQREQAQQWREKLEALKAQHQADFARNKKKEAAAVHSSEVLAGGTVSDDSEDME